MVKINYYELVEYLKNILNNHPLVFQTYINKIPTNNIIYTNIYLLFLNVEMYDTHKTANFRIVYNDILNVENDNELEIINTGTIVLREIINTIRQNKSIKLGNGDLLTTLNFGYNDNADKIVSVNCDIPISYNDIGKCYVI